MFTQLNDKLMANHYDLDKTLDIRGTKSALNNAVKTNIIFINSNNTPYKEVKALEELSYKLKKFAPGTEVLFNHDPYIQSILNRGRFLYGQKSCLIEGRPNQCHSNSCELWKLNPGLVSIMTGYALYKNGIWYYHTWLIRERNAPKAKYEIVETTNRMVGYFGFILIEDEANEFYKLNY